MKIEEINQLLADKFKKESHRLKSWGTKTDDKAAVSFAMAVSEFVRALMAHSRHRELRRLFKKCGREEWFQPVDYIRERMEATKTMAKAIENLAVKKESERPYGHKEKHHKHKNTTHKHKSHHHHHRSHGHS